MSKPERSINDAIGKLPAWAQSELEVYIRVAETKAALRITDYESQPDIPPPNQYRPDLTKGWTVNSYSVMERDPSNCIRKGCSSSTLRGESWKDTSSQSPQALFSTRLRALYALRREAELKAAKALWSIDQEIAAEKANPTPGPNESNE